MTSFLILLVLLGLMYFVLIVPRQRELRRHTQLMTQLVEGQQVMTGSGVYGTIRWIDGERVGLEVADSVVLEVAKRSIANLVDAGSDTSGHDGEDETGPAED